MDTIYNRDISHECRTVPATAVIPFSKSTGDLVLFMALTLNCSSLPSLAALQRTVITSCSLVVELNISARSTVILPHLDRHKMIKIN